MHNCDIFLEAVTHPKSVCSPVPPLHRSRHWILFQALHPAYAATVGEVHHHMVRVLLTVPEYTRMSVYSGVCMRVHVRLCAYVYSLVHCTRIYERLCITCVYFYFYILTCTDE